MQDPTLERMAAHASVREFLPDPVPESDIARAVSCAQMAATSSWIQAYSLVQVTRPEERARLTELCGGQPQVERAGAFFVVCGDVRRHRIAAERAGSEHVSNLETFLLAVIDASLFAQNLTLAFEALDYGCCYIGGLRNELAAVDALLELPDGVWPLFGLCVGRAARPAEPRPRLPLEAVWLRDRYPDDDHMWAQMERFDEDAERHYAARGLAGRSWTGGLWRKFRRPLREHLAPFYTSKGARLS